MQVTLNKNKFILLIIFVSFVLRSLFMHHKWVLKIVDILQVMLPTLVIKHAFEKEFLVYTFHTPTGQDYNRASHWFHYDYWVRDKQANWHQGTNILLILLLLLLVITHKKVYIYIWICEITFFFFFQKRLNMFTCHGNTNFAHLKWH